MSKKVFAIYDCSLENLVDSTYSYYQDDDIVLEILEPYFGINPNKRKPYNQRYEWEDHGDAA